MRISSLFAVAALGLFGVTGCEKSLQEERQDVAEAQHEAAKDVAEERQDVAEAKSEGARDIAEEQAEADKAAAEQSPGALPPPTTP